MGRKIWQKLVLKRNVEKERKPCVHFSFDKLKARKALENFKKIIYKPFTVLLPHMKQIISSLKTS